jgi:outer membrane protein assembly factor BamB
LQGSVNSHPVITGGVVLVGLENPPGIHAFAAGTCGTPPTGYSAFYPSSSAVRAGLAATPETVYLLEDRLLLAMFLDQQLWLDVSEAASFPSPWEGGPFAAADIITTPPVIADGVVYVGSQDGMVHAMDVENGEGLWSFDAESAIRGELVVVPGAVYVTTAAGEVIAIAGH